MNMVVTADGERYVFRMPFPGLTTTQTLALLAEINSARNLLAYGERVVRTAPFADTTRDPSLTMLSIGVEKLLKVSLGLSILNATGSWPSAQTMKSEFRHGLKQMDANLRTRLRDGVRGKEYEHFISGLLQTLEDDPIWPAILDALDRYGRSGRFHYLDILGDEPQRLEDPARMWDEAENIAVDSNAELEAMRSRALEDLRDQTLWDSFITALNNTIADSIHRWWEVICVLGRHGVLGDDNRAFGFEAHPDSVGRQE
ncbi:hypothetical protein AXZ95_0579 [Leifsonia sp. 115AMFTsu3.1]|nr:hypothetical protein AXZ95_0579 [Leifsonia sp. 115AMFTsu3.1]